MGAAYAPNYAGLFLGLWEERFVYSTTNPFRQFIKFYGRYIDDLFFIFSGSQQQLLDFHAYLNNANNNIKLSLEYSGTEINFLDLKISLDQQGTIHTSIYRKSTDRNTILRAESFHPKNLISNIPYGQFQRLRRICDSDSDFELQAQQMYDRFTERGYNKNNLTEAWSKARKLDRTHLINKNKGSTLQRHNKIYCPLQFSNMAYKIKGIINKNWDILSCDPSLGPLFSQRPVFSFKRAPTLKDKLVRSHLPPRKSRTFFKKPIGTHRCGSCNHCSQINRATSFMDSKLLRTYECRSFANCNSTFVVYRLDCVCGAFYVGRTKRKLKERFAEHKYAIRTENLDYPIAKHFKRMGHSNINDLKIMVLEVVSNDLRGGDRLKRLLQRETFWIDALGATTFPGLNEEIDFSPFL